MLFTKIEGAVAVVRCKGVFYQKDVYLRGNRLFAKWGAGFVGLKNWEKSTTKPDIHWDHIEGVEHEPGELGNLVQINAPAAKRVARRAA